MAVTAFSVCVTPHDIRHTATVWMAGAGRADVEDFVVPRSLEHERHRADLRLRTLAVRVKTMDPIFS